MDAGKHIYGIAYKIDNEKNGVWSRNMIVIDVYMEVWYKGNLSVTRDMEFEI